MSKVLYTVLVELHQTQKQAHFYFIRELRAAARRSCCSVFLNSIVLLNTVLPFVGGARVCSCCALAVAVTIFCCCLFVRFVLFGANGASETAPRERKKREKGKGKERKGKGGRGAARMGIAVDEAAAGAAPAFAAAVAARRIAHRGWTAAGSGPLSASRPKRKGGAAAGSAAGHRRGAADSSVEGKEGEKGRTVAGAAAALQRLPMQCAIVQTAR